MKHFRDFDGLSTDDIKRRILLNGTPIWSSIYKKELFVKNNLFFLENLFYEDNAVCAPLLLCASKIAKVNVPLYYYRVDDTSTVRAFNNPSLFDCLITARYFLITADVLTITRSLKRRLTALTFIIQVLPWTFTGDLARSHLKRREK